MKSASRRQAKQSLEADISALEDELEKEVKRIKEEYARLFGSKFELPSLAAVEEESEEEVSRVNQKIAEIKSLYTNKIPPIR